MTTTRKIRPINLRDFQSRHLQTHKRLLVVEPLREQPPEYVGSFHAGVFHTTVVRRGGTEEPGPAVFGAYSEDGEWSIRSPYQPGDVVPCREPIRYSVEHDNYYYVADDKGCGTLAYIQMSGVAKRDIPANRIPESAIRLHPVCVSVECRRVSRIDELEALDAAFEGSVIVGTMKESGKPPRTQEWINGSAEEAFRDDWHRRHKRQADAFERAFGWFYSLRLEK